MTAPSMHDDFRRQVSEYMQAKGFATELVDAVNQDAAIVRCWMEKEFAQKKGDQRYGLIHVVASGLELLKNANQMRDLVEARCQCTIRTWNLSSEEMFRVT